jgi:predicted HTH domain antitoxin
MKVIMANTTFEIQLPALLLQFGLNRDEVQRRITEWLVLSLFTEERISSGKAARLLHLSRVEFLDLLRLRGVAYLDSSSDDLNDEFDSAIKLSNTLP